MVVYGHFGSLGPGHMTGMLFPDEIDQVWWLAWTALALPHGHNVFSAQWQNYPAGENFGVNGSMLALGVLFMPITKLFGPVVTWNIALRLAVVLSASSMCFVLRRWTTWWPAAFVGGLIYGFSAYMAYYDDNYLFLIFVPLPPVIFLLLHEILVRQQWRPGRTGALLGVVCALQFFIWSEVLASTVVMGVVAVVLFLLVSRRHLAERWRRYAMTAFAYSLGVGGFLLLFPVIYALAGPQSIRGTVQRAVPPSDLFGAFVPSSQWLGTNGLTAMANQRFAYATALYLGLPLVVVLVSFAIFLRQRRAILFAGSLALIAFVLSLGSRLRVDGHETSFPLPFVVFENRPVVGGLIPVRFSLYTALFAAAMFAIGLDELWRRMRRSGRPAWLSARWRIVATVGALATLTAAAVIPLAPRHTQLSTSTNVPSLFTTAAVEAIPVGSVVLAYPYPDALGGLDPVPHGIMLDQAVAGMRFKLIGGYGWFPSPRGTNNTVSPSVLKPESVQAIFDAAFYGNATAQMAPLSKSNLTALRVFLRKYDVQTVVVSPSGADPAAVVSYVTAVIGPPVESGGVTAWFHVKERLLVDRVHVAPVAGGNGETFPKLVPHLFVPANNATLSSTAVLDALVTGYFKVTKVEFYLTGASQHDTLIGAARQTTYGWITGWNTTTVANGTYTLQSVAYDVAGRSGHSNGITITVNN